MQWCENMEENKADGLQGSVSGGQDRVDEDNFVISDRLVIFLLIVFTLMIGAWWALNLYMGRWI